MSAPDLIAPEMSDNEALRGILALVQLIESDIRGQYDTLETTGSLSIGQTGRTRDAKANAFKTVVVNEGETNALRVYEDDCLVDIVAPGGRWVSPLNGAGEIRIRCLPGESTNATITTFLRNLTVVPNLVPALLIVDDSDGSTYRLVSNDGILGLEEINDD